MPRPPDFVAPGVRLYCGDCLEILPELETGSVDAVVCDPPYGIGFKYESHDDSEQDYAAMMQRVVPVAALRNNRAVIGIEKEKKYFDLAVRRIKAELNRHPLFEPPVAP